MKRVKILGLLSVVAAALMALSGTAAATTVTSDAGTTPNLVMEAEGHVTLDNPIAKIPCASKLEGDVTSHGSGVTVGGAIDSLSFTNCTNNWHVTVLLNGSFEFHALPGGDGNLTVSGILYEATRFGITCRYSTSGTAIGTATDGEQATLDVSAAIPFHSGSGLCGSSATTLTGSYAFTSPTNVSFHS